MAINIFFFFFLAAADAKFKDADDVHWRSPDHGFVDPPFPARNRPTAFIHRRWLPSDAISLRQFRSLRQPQPLL
jgi:hypothetical protein